ncbi:hypothetical protein [Clostridium cadaveris]|uniref:hypothetical protein n=1 Tax=Clostridium cadaveris TaxID=1529 RepID=UPI0015B723EF|nr:hypothetical protein [Clostridium cadaveris]NWK12799.1 hypothetical protein [Clostridium cadaveris]
MKKDMNNKNIYIINLNSIIYGIIFLLILISVIYFISKGMGSTSVDIYSSGAYEKDQVMAIEAVANNVTGRINNIIAVSAIFFAVIVSSISVFQFIKIKDFDKEINELLKKTQILNEDLKSSNNLIENLKSEINMLINEKNKLKIENVKIKLELNIYKINNAFYKVNNRLDKTIELINESINLVDKYPGIIDSIELSKLYYKKAYFAYDICQSKQAIQLGEFALDIVKDKYHDMIIDDMSERDYVENLGKFLIDIYSEQDSYQLIDDLIKKIEPVLDFQLDERLEWLYAIPTKDAIEIIKENYKYYGEYFLIKFTDRYNRGKFDKFKNNRDFVKLLENFNIKI